MRILLLGEFSNVHATLALGLRKLGHDVVVASDGDEWKNYPRDIDLHRPSLKKWDSLRYFLRLNRQFKDFKGFDIVQLINPIFVPLKAERHQSFFHSFSHSDFRRNETGNTARQKTSLLRGHPALQSRL